MGQVATKNTELMSSPGLGKFACLWEAAVPREKGDQRMSGGEDSLWCPNGAKVTWPPWLGTASVSSSLKAG